jgi:hypothetical protein
MENTPGLQKPEVREAQWCQPQPDAHQTANFEAGSYQFGFETTLFYANTLVAAKKTFFTKLCSAFGTPASAPGLASVSTSGCSGANCMKYTRNGNSR